MMDEKLFIKNLLFGVAIISFIVFIIGSLFISYDYDFIGHFFSGIILSFFGIYHCWLSNKYKLKEKN